MRRAMLLTLVAMALPTAALANSIDFTTGRFENGTVTRDSSGKFTMPSFSVTVTGSLGTITLSTDSLGVGCDTNSLGMCTFTSGTVTVKNTHGATVFTDSIDNGMVIKISKGATITADLLPNAMDPSGGIVSYTLSFAPGPNATHTLIGGTAFASSAVIPEPSALLLLGTGVIGLAGMMRRKVKHGTGAQSL